MGKAEISGTGKITGESLIADKAIITDTPLIEDSVVNGYAIVTGFPRLYQTIVGEHALITGSPRVYNSQVGGTVVITDSAEVRNSSLHGNARITRDSKVFDSNIGGEVVIAGGTVMGLVLDGQQRIHEGVWTREPIHIQHPDIPLALTECVDGKLIIGCYCRSADWWKQNAFKVAEEFGWTVEQAEWVWEQYDRHMLPLVENKAYCVGGTCLK